MDSLISIVTTLYNYARYIGELLESVKNQSYKNWELIIVDDGSLDNPYEIISPYILKYGTKIKYIRHSGNRGYAVAKNTGIKFSSGKYIVMIDADDILTTNSLRLRKEALDKEPDKLWIHGEVLVMDGVNSKNLSRRSIDWKKNFRQRLIKQGLDLTKEYHHRLIHAQSVMVKPELHKKYGLYDETLRFSADNEMWRRVIRFKEIPVHIWDFVAIYRVHDARMSRSKYKKDRARKVKKRLIMDVERRFKEGIENSLIWT
ncbi:MAG: glycosyltransferase [Promethearchaeota archaeon]|jgi:glycosyltransferase involved in cell wall biosynthesis